MVDAAGSGQSLSVEGWLGVVDRTRNKLVRRYKDHARDAQPPTASLWTTTYCGPRRIHETVGFEDFDDAYHAFRPRAHVAGADVAARSRFR